ncbi:MAG: TraR/DksA family transcriptional regulator [Pyrinomonadaceae bacterium]
MVTAIEPLIREQLIDRRHKLEVAANGFNQDAELSRLLREVDSALQRMEEGTYGLCDFCHDPVETERLIANPHPLVSRPLVTKRATSAGR